MFGSGRTGSSWLSFMLGSLPGHARWNEPLVGYLFGHTYYERYSHRRETSTFILGSEHRSVWLRSIRTLVLDGASARFPGLGRGGFVVIKEPHGSIGAPLLMEALPESRMIFLVRDPRDVVASNLHLHLTPPWPEEAERRVKRAQQAKADPERAATTLARTYCQDIERAGQAFEAHPGHKAMVRYEDLRADTLGSMTRICASLGTGAREADLVAAIERYDWEGIPDDQKGPGKMRRKARPGAWREDLSLEQEAVVEHVAAPVLARFYPEA